MIARIAQLVAVYVVVLAENYIPWPLSFVVMLMLLLAVLPVLADALRSIRERTHRELP